MGGETLPFQVSVTRYTRTYFTLKIFDYLIRNKLFKVVVKYGK